MIFPWDRIGGVLVVWLCACWAGSASTGSNPQAYPDRVPIVIDRTEFSFGTILEYDDTFLVLESRCIPRLPGQLYGWQISGIVGARSALVREKLVLPSAPETWGESGDEEGVFLISDDRTTCLWERYMPIIGEAVGNHWGFAEGDPRGIYEIQVTLAGVLLDEFLFFVD